MEDFSPEKMLRRRRMIRQSMANFHFDKVLSARSSSIVRAIKIYILVFVSSISLFSLTSLSNHTNDNRSNRARLQLRKGTEQNPTYSPFTIVVEKKATTRTVIES